MEINKARKETIDKSFICKDKSIHFGALHVVYIRDVLDILKELEEKDGKEL